MLTWALPNLLTALFAAWSVWRLRRHVRGVVQGNWASAGALAQRESTGTVPGSQGLQFLFSALFLWSSFQLIGSLMPSERATFVATQLAYIGITLTPVAWFLFAFTVGRRIARIPRTTLILVCVMPAVTFTMVATTQAHALFWSSWEVREIGALSKLVTQKGPWFYVHTGYSYLMIVIATAILVFTLTQSKQHRVAAVASILAPAVATAGNVFFISPLNPIPSLDFTTVTFAMAVAILDRGILRQGLFNNLPVLRGRVVEKLSDPVLVITHRGVVVDANSAAVDAWNGDGKALLGQPLSQLIGSIDVPVLTQHARNHEVTVRDRVYEVAATMLDGTADAGIYALVFRDFTERRAAERQLERAKDELERLANTDALTELYNRRVFMQRLAEEVERVKRHGGALSVLLFDLDHFKSVNDTYGHETGDRVLVGVAQVATQTKRQGDVAARLGGEEFVLLLPETDQDGALRLADRLRSGIEQYPFEDDLGKPLRVTASVGASTTLKLSTQADAILRTADQALYRAKNAGRNRICFDATA